jgi:AhpD family alkylhydroperoxidase
VDRRDPFPRRTATVGVLAPWAVELVRNLPTVLRTYGPGRSLDPRGRERVILAVTEVNGCRYCAWIHGAWQDFLGEADVDNAEEAVLAYARACAEAARPLDPSALLDVLPAAAVAEVRATVAQIEVANLVGNTVDGLLARFTRKRPFSPLGIAREAATVAVALPVAVPMVSVAAVMRAVDRAAPALPEVVMPEPGEANLLAHLLAQAAPAWLGNAAVRLAVLGLPFSLTVALRAGRTAATVRIGKGAIAVENGVASDAVALIEGDVEPLLRLATGSILRQLPGVRVRPA